MHGAARFHFISLIKLYLFLILSLDCGKGTEAIFLHKYLLSEASTIVLIHYSFKV